MKIPSFFSGLPLGQVNFILGVTYDVYSKYAGEILRPGPITSSGSYSLAKQGHPFVLSRLSKDPAG